MLLERLDGGSPVQADEACSLGLRDAKSRSRRHPALGYANADRPGGKDLDRNDGIGEGFRPREHVCLMKLSVITRTAA